MKVLVTGAAGFIGMHVAQRLSPRACFIDVKAAFSQADLESHGLRVWRL